MVFLISWNVAGLSTTVNRIHEAYNGDSNNNNNGKNKSKTQQQQNNNKTKQCCPGLADYFARHGSPDIVCLQEHKIPKSQLSNRSEPRGCAHVEGYESFWSCCVDDKSKGMNGVCTYAKKGTVLTANAFALGSSSLDDQGRCVVTDHGTFVVFNVYVPASGGQPLARKMQFLQSLRRAMKYQREVQNKAVMLVGDLNISMGKLDVYWKNRVLHVKDILTQVKQQQAQPDSLPVWKRELAKAWPIIVQTMATQKVVPTQTTNSHTGAKYERHRLCVTMENPTRTIYLGKHESNPDYCYCGYNFLEASYYTDPETDELMLASESHVVCLSVLAELMSKLCNVEWNDETLRAIANSEDAGRARVHPPRQWLMDLLEEDDMVDVFCHFYPTAEARFTCWHQFTNMRYINNGARIDYTIVDRSLLPFVQRGGNLRTGEVLEGSNPSVARNPPSSQGSTDSKLDPLSEDAALAAATARGRFQPVSFQGGGIIEASPQTLNTQFGTRHSGMIYTPPSFSDHIAVSVLLGSENETGGEGNGACCPCSGESWGKLVLNEKDPNTKKAQPHKTQKSIASFFGNGKSGAPKASLSTSASSTTLSATTTSSKASLPQKRPVPGTVKSFFQTKTSVATSSNPSQSDSDRNTKAKPSSNATKGRKKPPAHSILNHFTKK